MSRQSNRLGDLQIAIMQIIWDRHEATVSEVHQALLAERGLAFTTIATMLRKMEDRGLVHHHLEGRQYIYTALVAESEVQRSMATDLTDSLFRGDVADLVSHLLDTREIDPDEIKRLKSMIARKEKQAGGQHDV